PPDLDHQGQSQTKITKWVTFDPPSEGHRSAVVEKVANRSVNTLRAAIERAIAHLKDWKIFATRYRGPLTRFTLVAKAVTALAFYKKGW
ncbi:hypothetical protein ACH4YO_42185, partial [Streptomyces noursei]